MFMILGADFHMIKENCNASPKKESNSLHSRVLTGILNFQGNNFKIM